MTKLPKYRAFHKTEKQMYEVTSLDLLNQEVSILREFLNADMTPRGEFYEDIVGLSDVELVQSTGLSDSKGCEVFEGDVLQNHFKIPPLLVEFKNGMFGYEYAKQFSPIATMLGNHTVIGNRWEHPELLKQL